MYICLQFIQHILMAVERDTELQATSFLAFQEIRGSGKVHAGLFNTGNQSPR